MDFDDIDFDDLPFIDGSAEDAFPSPADAPPVGPPPKAIAVRPRHPEQGARPQVQPVFDPAWVDTHGEPNAPPGPREHHAMRVTQPTVDVYAQQRPMPRPPPSPSMPLPPYHTQAIGQGPPLPPRRPPPGARAMGQASGGEGSMLGLSLLGLTLGVAVGAKMNGVAGAAAGGLFAASGVNLLRASQQYVKGTPAADKEGRISLTYSVVGAAAGGAIVYRYIYGGGGGDPKAFKPNPEGDDCDIRPVGP